MRTYCPNNKYDTEEATRIKAEPWQLDLLKLNPGYVSWGPHEDYMWKEKGSWDSRVITPTWGEFGFGLDDLNECVNFYFSIHRDSEECGVCGGSGYHPDAQWISESFYGHSTPFRQQTREELHSIAVLASFGGGGESAPVVQGFPSNATLARYGSAFTDFCESMRDGEGSWHDRITEEEAAALVEGNRGKKGTTAAQFNSAQHRHGLDAHDAINRSILIKARCQRLGVPLHCEACEGRGHQFTSPAAHVSLTLWILHPRKGCSRGVEVSRVEQSELPEVFTYLRNAAERNAQRFSLVP